MQKEDQSEWGVCRRSATHLGARRQPLHRRGDGGPLAGDHDLTAGRGGPHEQKSV